jgi:hypothetical protein
LIGFGGTYYDKALGSTLDGNFWTFSRQTPAQLSWVIEEICEFYGQGTAGPRRWICPAQVETGAEPSTGTNGGQYGPARIVK